MRIIGAIAIVIAIGFVVTVGTGVAEHDAFRYFAVGAHKIGAVIDHLLHRVQAKVPAPAKG